MKINRRDFLNRTTFASLGMLGASHLNAASDVRTLRAGAAIADITPPMGASLKGPIGGNGVVKEIHDPMSARALVLESGSIRLAICVCDLCVLCDEVMEGAKHLISERCALPTDRILISTTHSHAVPRVVYGLSDAQIDLDYYKTVERKIAEAVCSAVKNLVPAEIAYGVVQKPEFIQGRRWRTEAGANGPNPFGERTDRAWMYAGPKTRLDPEPLGRPDNNFSVVCVRHLDGIPLAVLGNYSVHYVGGFKRNCVSADYFACFAEEMGKLLNTEKPAGDHPPFVGIMSNGNSGNMSPATVRPAGYDGMRKVGRTLAEAALGLYNSASYSRNSDVIMIEERLELGVRKPDAQRIQWAKDVLAGKWNKPAHSWKNIYAQRTLQLAEFPDTVTPKFQAIRIGDLAIAANPCEMYAETGLEIRERSPVKTTFNIELANGFSGYLPPPEQHELGGYTTWPSISSFLEVDASEKIKEHLLKLLAATTR